MKQYVLIYTLILIMPASILNGQILPKYMDPAFKSKSFEIPEKTDGFGTGQGYPVEAASPGACYAPEEATGRASTPAAVRANGRVGSEQPWTTLGRIDAEYNDALQGYTDTVSRTYRYHINQDPNAYYQYTLAPGTADLPADTIRFEHRVYDEELAWYTFDLAYEKINGELVRTKRNKGYLEWQTDNGGTVYLYDTSYTTVVAAYYVDGKAIPYIQSERTEINSKGGTAQYFSSMTWRQDGSLYQSLDKITEKEKTTFRKFSRYDNSGALVHAEIDSSAYNDQGQMAFRRLQHSVDGTTWETSLEYRLTFDDQDRIIEELDMSGARERSRYTWDGDRISEILVEKRYLSKTSPWENYRKFSYAYSNDSTIEVLKRWDRGNAEWAHNSRQIFMVTGANEGTQLMVTFKEDFDADLQEFKTVLIDSIFYDATPEAPNAVYTYTFDEGMWRLARWEETAWDDKGRIREKIQYSLPENGDKTIYQYNDPVNPERATTIGRYDATAFTGQRPVAWKMISKVHYTYYQYAKEGYSLLENMGWDSYDGGYYWRRVLNEHNLTDQIVSSQTSDVDASDGIDWWTRYYDEYAYNSDNQLVRTHHYTREAKEQPFSSSYESLWTYHDTGLPDGFYLSYHGTDPISHVRKYQWVYDEDPLAQYCALSISGDTVLAEGEVTLTARFDDPNAIYQWSTRSGTVVGQAETQVIDTKGQYMLSGMKVGCISESVVDIYDKCVLDVLGDTILYRTGPAELHAVLSDVAAAQYTWYDESGGIAGNRASLAVSQPGVYTAVAHGDFCYGQGTLEVSLVTGLEKAYRQQDWLVYPNPTEGSITLLLPGDTPPGTSVTVQNVQGETVRVLGLPAAGSPVDMDFSGLPRGVYVLTTGSGASEYRQRIVLY